MFIYSCNSRDSLKEKQTSARLLAPVLMLNDSVLVLLPVAVLAFVGGKVPTEQGPAKKQEIYCTFNFLDAKLFHHWALFALKVIIQLRFTSAPEPLARANVAVITSVASISFSKIIFIHAHFNLPLSSADRITTAVTLGVRYTPKKMEENSILLDFFFLFWLAG